MTGVVRGRLRESREAPELGERMHEVVRVGGVFVEQILSGTLAAGVEYDQDHDEWVVVLHGRGVLEVDGEPVELCEGDWVLLPTHTPHRLVDAEPGTCWLALHAVG